MELIKTPIKDLVILKPVVFADDRGYFFESFNQKKFEELTGCAAQFVQDNQSLSQQNVLRGLHFQAPPYAQDKLVRVLNGAVLDVAVDIRIGSPTYGQHFCCELSAANKLQMFIPAGFAHGFLTLEPDSIFAYKCSNYYHQQSEGCLLWNDADLKIDWPAVNPVVSPKDAIGKAFKSFKSPFSF